MVLQQFLMCHYIILHVRLHVLSRSFYILKRTLSSSFFIPVSHVRYIYDPLSMFHTGDAYRYTIQPVFRNIHKEFRCHVSHRSEPVLYELFVFIQIPQLGFQTPRSSRIVYNRDLAFQKRGQFQADFLNVEHSVEFDLHEELVIHGREEKPGRMEYNITPAILTKSKEVCIFLMREIRRGSVLPVRF